MVATTDFGVEITKFPNNSDQKPEFIIKSVATTELGGLGGILNVFKMIERLGGHKLSFVTFCLFNRIEPLLFKEGQNNLKHNLRSQA